MRALMKALADKKQGPIVGYLLELIVIVFIELQTGKK